MVDVQGLQGKTGEVMPDMPDEFVLEISERYIELYQLITGKEFIRENQENLTQRIENNVNTFLEKSSQFMNIVVADSGSTKADWIIYNSGHTQR